ncbi:Site-specific recombinase XerD [Streptomyces sp. cf386]|uniref:site-specific integrase n=1 Tax=Streptomyces sp. cf386 TaxID=1761904 RepID=UPI0008826894|nr:tyrosine-type recombinase/integrase [Streptomyces sp. cf386]SDM47822.1 Site-specific recombinase XerD [Streptomyces sp. cf386]
MPEIKKVVLGSGAVRYRFVVDIGYEPKRDEVTGEVIINKATGKPVLKRNQLTVTKNGLTEAKAELARIINQRATGTFIAPSEVTVSEWINTWLEMKARDLEESTITGYRNALVHVHAYLGHLRLQALTEEDVESMVAWLLVAARRRGGKPGTGLRPSTVEGILGRLKEALNRAVTKKIVHLNVAQEVNIPRRARKEDRRNYPRPEPWNVVEVKEFLVGIRDDRLFAPLLLSLMGLRPAEVAGLKWEHIDLEAGSLSIANTRTMIGNAKVVEKDTKTEAGERTLPLPSPVHTALLAFRAVQEAERAAQGSWYNCAPTSHIFVDSHGLLLNTRHLREHAYALIEKLGLRRVRLYDARHSCLTFLAVNGVPDVVLAAWAGHVNASFTKRVYVRPSADDLRVASDHLSALLGFGGEDAA